MKGSKTIQLEWHGSTKSPQGPRLLLLCNHCSDSTEERGHPNKTWILKERRGDE